ncbi:MAG: zf-HC2 domain-containing protein [Solirubrobacterales bacterium]
MIRRLFGQMRYMREHRWTHSHLSEYLDAELDAPGRARVEEHVGICPHCHRVLATLRRTLAGLRALPAAADPGPEVADGVIERLRGEGRS